MKALLESKMLKRKVLGNLRQLKICTHLVDFASNDYLGLARSQELKEGVSHLEMGNQFQRLGSTGSRLLTGNSLYAQNLEETIASFHGYEAGLLFGCGYLANIGLLSALATEEDQIFFDVAVHASLHDGIRLSRAKAFPFRHNDWEHLEQRLKNSSEEGNRLICIESVYSTDGSIAPLAEISRIAKQYQAHLIVDEAHAVGVLGPEGRGLVAQAELMGEVGAQIVTFGKALGCYGAIVLGSALLKEFLINFARSCIYTTALPFPILSAIKSSYNLFPGMEKERGHLQSLIHLFNRSKSPIQSIEIKGNSAIKEKVEKLNRAGFDVRALMSPTVQRGHEVIRICLHSFNTAEEVQSLLQGVQNE